MKGVFVIEQNNNVQQKEYTYRYLDNSITDPQERNRIVHEIIDTIPPQKLRPYYLEELTKYLIQTPENKKQKTILTDNRMVTVVKRQVSFQGLVSKLQNGQDGIYNFMTGGDKNILFVPKIQITEDDIKTIPGLKELREQIKKTEIKQKAATGKKKYLLTKQLIEMRQDQYVLKSAYKTPISVTKLVKGINKIDLDQNITINEKGEPQSSGLVSFFNPQHVRCLLNNYSRLKEDCWGCFNDDLYYLMEDFDKLVNKALKQDYTVLFDIMVYKIDGMSNKDIVKTIKEKYGISYSVEYLSSLWCKKIPKIIAQKAKQDWIVWHYTIEQKGKWKRCSRCHEIKLAHPFFFSKNKTSKDGYYSLCKKCRNKKTNPYKVYTWTNEINT